WCCARSASTPSAASSRSSGRNGTSTGSRSPRSRSKTSCRSCDGRERDEFEEVAVSELHVLRVFCNAEWDFGNPLGVFLNGGEVPEERRQAVAAELGFSETVYVDDAAAGRIRIFTPGLELGFAGHPSVGTAWLLAKERQPVEVLRPPAGEVGVRTEG